MIYVPVAEETFVKISFAQVDRSCTWVSLSSILPQTAVIFLLNYFPLFFNRAPHLTVMDNRLKMDIFSSLSACWIGSSMHGVLPSDQKSLERLCSPSVFPIPVWYSLSSFSHASEFLWCMAESHQQDRSVGYVKVMPSRFKFCTGRPSASPALLIKQLCGPTV